MQITRNVVHDLRNFLNAFSVVLQLAGRAPHRAEPALAMARRQATDMKDLVDQMIEYSVVLGDAAPLALEQVDLRQLYDEISASARPAIEQKGLAWNADFDPALSVAITNRLKLKQIAINLLSNATRYTKAGIVRFAFAKVGSTHWSIHVSDTGVGIAPEDTDRVFNEFERAIGEDITGAGLGLAIVKQLCKLLGGRMEFVSREEWEPRSRFIFLWFQTSLREIAITALRTHLPWGRATAAIHATTA